MSTNRHSDKTGASGDTLHKQRVNTAESLSGRSWRAAGQSGTKEFVVGFLDHAM
jgi:hypothetical protein